MFLKFSRDSPGADGYNNSKKTWLPQDDILDEIELKGYQPFRLWATASEEWKETFRRVCFFFGNDGLEFYRIEFESEIER